MLWQRLVFGSLMIVALVGVVVADAWLSAGIGHPPSSVGSRPSADPAAAGGDALSAATGGDASSAATGGDASSTAAGGDALSAATGGGRYGGGAAAAGAGRQMTDPVTTGGGCYGAARAGFLLTLLVAGLAVASVYELGRLCAAGGYRPMRHWAALVALALVCVPWVDALVRLGVLGGGGAGETALSTPVLLILVLATGFLGTCIGVLARRTTEQAVAAMGVTLFIIFYIGLLAACAIGIRFVSIGPAGAALLVYFILTVKFGDIGAFFVGSAIGRHKLAPWLSPGKTWEGAGGAVLGCVLMAELGLWWWSRLDLWLGAPPLSAVQAIGFGVLMAVFGHTGDLVESAIKRSVGAKDSARVVPAFGGLLDILDSPLFTAPIAWGFLTFCIRLG